MCLMNKRKIVFEIFQLGKWPIKLLQKRKQNSSNGGWCYKQKNTFTDSKIVQQPQQPMFINNFSTVLYSQIRSQIIGRPTTWILCPVCHRWTLIRYPAYFRFHRAVEDRTSMSNVFQHLNHNIHDF